MKKKSIIISIIAVAVLVVASLLTWILWPKKSNKDIYTDAIKQSLGYTKLKDVNKEDFDLEKLLDGKKYKVSLKGTSTTEGETENNSAEVYISKDQLYALVSGKLDEKDAVIEAIFKDEKLYFTVKDILSKYYYVEQKIEEQKGDTNLNLDSDKLIDLFVEAFEDAIEAKNVTSESDTVSINGKDYKVDKYGYTFTGKDLYGVIESFIKKIKNDKDLYKQFKDLFEGVDLGQEISIDEMFNVVVEQLAPIKDLGKLFTYTVALYKGDVVQTNITVNIEAGEMALSGSLVVNEITVDNKTYAQAYVSVMGQRLFDVVLNEKEEGKYDLKFSMMKQDMITGTIVSTDTKLEVTIKGTEMLGEELDINLVLNVKGNTLDGKLKGVMADSTMDYNIAVEEVTSIPDVDVSNSAPFEEMTEQDKAILDKLMPEEIDEEISDDFFF